MITFFKGWNFASVQTAARIKNRLEDKESCYKSKQYFTILNSLQQEKETNYESDPAHAMPIS
jgi:hypothetical protein